MNQNSRRSFLVDVAQWLAGSWVALTASTATGAALAGCQEPVCKYGGPPVQPPPSPALLEPIMPPAPDAVAPEAAPDVNTTPPASQSATSAPVPRPQPVQRPKKYGGPPSTKYGGPRLEF